MPVPDTGAPAAAGYAERSGIPYREGLVRNRYTGRTFIQPSQTMRHRGVTLKLNPLREVVRGKRLTVVDDSIVRGTTTKQIVALLRQGRRRRGPCPDQRAADLPPVLLRDRHPDRDRADRGDPLGRRDPRRSSAPIRSATCRSRGVLAALDLPYDQFCFACFDGNYPEPVPYDARSRKFMLEEEPGIELAPPLVLPGVQARGVADPRRAYVRPASTSPRANGPSSSSGTRSSRPGGRRSSAGSAGSPAPSRSRPAPRPVARQLDRRGRDEDRDRRRRSTGSTRSGSTSWRCAPTTSSAAAPRRCSSSTTSPSAGSTRRTSPSSSAGSPPAAARPAARCVGGETAEHPG